MPFGAEWFGAAGHTRFRIWAPAATRVELCLENTPAARNLTMHALDGGWFELDCDEAPPGTRYRFRIDGGPGVPDPASRSQPDGVHGPSEVVDPAAFDWGLGHWRGRAWEEAVIYELHVGTFSASGDFSGVQEHLDHVVGLGATAIELMPVGAFPGKRGWGYDGVFPFAPHASYGCPRDLKRLVRAAHERGLMILLDVVYNHFGPEGNELHRYAPGFFSTCRRTPWGPAINFDGRDSAAVRDFFIHNALYWLEEYRFDGLRLDAAHAICDTSRPDFLEELAAAVAAGPGARREVHLVLEHDSNAAHYLWHGYRAQWDDDLHHALHVLITDERDGYYVDYAGRPLNHLGRSLAEGFAYQGEPSAYRGGQPRGEASAELPPYAFVGFLQNHDQVGNRALGERLTELAAPEALRAATVVLLLAPHPPLLFMGQEWGSQRRFTYFCDLNASLGAAVNAERREEFARFSRFHDPAVRARIPDPQDAATFAAARLDWDWLHAPQGRNQLALHRELLALRRTWIVPLGRRIRAGTAHWRVLHGQGLEVTWPLDRGDRLVLLANLAGRALKEAPPSGRCLYATHSPGARLPPWFAGWFLDTETAA